jgi:hypothetical protein
VTVDRERLLRDEEEGWARFRAAVGAVPPARAEEPTVTPDGWSPKDTIFHVAAWLDLCADVIGRIVDGTWDPSTAEEEDPAFVERANAERFARARAMTPQEAEASLARARERAREAFASMPEVTPDAWGWFEESGPMHYAKHVHDLAAFAAGTAPDPEVGPLLQAETDGWLELVAALDAIPPDRTTEPAPDGWSLRDGVHHLARWLETAADGIERNGSWYQAPPAPEDLIDEMNDGFLREAREVTPEQARERLERARTRIREALSSLASPSDDAKASFRWNTAEHYEEHLAMLRPFLPGAD